MKVKITLWHLFCRKKHSIYICPSTRYVSKVNVESCIRIQIMHCTSICLLRIPISGAKHIIQVSLVWWLSNSPPIWSNRVFNIVHLLRLGGQNKCFITQLIPLLDYMLVVHICDAKFINFYPLVFHTAVKPITFKWVFYFSAPLPLVLPVLAPLP